MRWFCNVQKNLHISMRRSVGADGFPQYVVRILITYSCFSTPGEGGRLLNAYCCKEIINQEMDCCESPSFFMEFSNRSITLYSWFFAWDCASLT